MTAGGEPRNVVVDKDWVALMLAQRMNAELLLFATDVDAVYAGFGTNSATPCPTLTTEQARQLIRQGLDAGSMAPKLASALEFVEHTGRDAIICSVDELLQASAGDAGTRICTAPPG